MHTVRKLASQEKVFALLCCKRNKFYIWHCRHPLSQIPNHFSTHVVFLKGAFRESHGTLFHNLLSASFDVRKLSLLTGWVTHRSFHHYKLFVEWKRFAVGETGSEHIPWPLMPLIEKQSWWKNTSSFHFWTLPENILGNWGLEATDRSKKQRWEGEL